MAQESQSQLNPVQLREKIARSRHEVARDLTGLKYELDFKRKFRRAFRHNTALWIGGALAVGLLLALMQARTKKVYVNAAGKRVKGREKLLAESGLLVTLAKAGMTVAQPILTAYLAKKVKGRSSP